MDVYVKEDGSILCTTTVGEMRSNGIDPLKLDTEPSRSGLKKILSYIVKMAGYEGATFSYSLKGDTALDKIKDGSRVVIEIRVIDKAPGTQEQEDKQDVIPDVHMFMFRTIDAAITACKHAYNGRAAKSSLLKGDGYLLMISVDDEELDISHVLSEFGGEFVEAVPAAIEHADVIIKEGAVETLASL